jgi:thioredoxin
MSDTVRCPSCGAPNRAPLTALRDGQARCGNCKTPLKPADQPIDTTDKLFAADVLESELPVLVDFWAPWCGPCKMMAPVLQQFAAKYAGRLKVVKLNTEVYPQTADPYEVRSIPLILVFRNGQVVQQIVGAMPLARLEAELTSSGILAARPQWN